MSNVEASPQFVDCEHHNHPPTEVQHLSPKLVALGEGPDAMTVRRTLPQLERSFVGAWCFADHYGPNLVEATGGMVVSQEDIEVMQPADVSELFQRDSALTVSGGAGPSKRIHVFGLEQSNLAVTVDGVPQGPTSWHHTGSNVIDPAFLKSVEVEAGTAAADAGFGAAAGAVR